MPDSDQQSCLFIVPWALHHPGGVSVAVESLANEFGRRERQGAVVLDASFGSDRLSAGESASAYKTYRLTLRNPQGGEGERPHWFYFLRYLPVTALRLARLIRKERVTVVNVHYPSLAALNVLAALRIVSDVKLVLTFHGTDYRKLGELRGMECSAWQWLLARANAIVTCSASAAEEVRMTWPDISRKQVVIRNGVESMDIEDSCTRGRVPECLHDVSFILTVGTLEDKKGQDILIEAFNELAPENSDLHLAIIGRDGDARSKIESRIAASEYRQRIHLFLNVQRPDVLATMKKARLFVLPSRIEPFGIVILEAAILRVPVIASSVGGIPEILAGDTGVLVPPDDVPELVRALRFSMEDSSACSARVRRLSNRVKKQFTWKSAVDQYLDIFNLSN